MYPYYYPSFFTPAKRPGVKPAPAMQGMPGMQGMPMTPGMQGTPGMQELPAVPGKTAGDPVEPVPPAPITVQPPPVSFQQQPGPSVTTDIEFTQAYLKTQIGKKVRIEFLIGTNMTTDRLGILTDVGISYVIIEPEGTDDRMLCDIYSIKFVTFFA